MCISVFFTPCLFTIVAQPFKVAGPHIPFTYLYVMCFGFDLIYNFAYVQLVASLEFIRMS
jgi:hypothetical protein